MRRLVEITKKFEATQAVLISTILLIAALPAVAQNSPSAKPTDTKSTVSREIVVSIPDRRLAVIEDGRVVRIYSVAVGASVSPSPEGEFKIINRIENPTYYAHGKVIAPGKANPLGTRWMGLSTKGYGIHGTNAPRSIGKAASHGCIRMSKSDLEELFGRVKVGDAVKIRGERDTEVARIFGQNDKEAATVTLASAIHIAEARTVTALSE